MLFFSCFYWDLPLSPTPCGSSPLCGISSQFAIIGLRIKNVLKEGDIICGVPQGAQLGPVMPLAKINGLSRNAPVAAILVSDKNIVSHTRVVPICNINMQKILDKLRVEGRRVGMIPNRQKSKVIFIDL